MLDYARVMIALLLPAFYQAPTPDDLNLSVPDKVSRRFRDEGLWRDYELSPTVNPFFLSADFDSDGKTDYVVLIQRRKDQATYVAFVLTSQRKVILEANTQPAFAGWEVLQKGERIKFDADKPTQTMSADMLELKMSGGSAYYSWSGRSFKVRVISD